jgi:WD40 repeat protein
MAGAGANSLPGRAMVPGKGMVMRKVIRCLVPLTPLLLAGFASGTPQTLGRPELRPVISADNAARVRKVRQLPRDVWQIVWGPRRWQVSLLGWEQPVEVLDAETFRPVRQIGTGAQLVHFAVSADGASLALVKNATTVEIRRDLRGGEGVVLETHNRQPAAAFSPDGKLLATGGFGTQAKLWERTSGRLVRSLESAPEGGLTPVFSPDGKLLAVGNRNGQTRLFAVSTGKLLHTLPRAMSQELKFSPEGRTLAVAYVDGSIGLWKVADGSLVHLRRTGAQEVYSLDWSPRGDILVTSGLHGKITLWDRRDLSALKELEAPEWAIRVRFSPDGTRLFSAGGAVRRGPDRCLTIWGVPSGPGK